MTRRVSRKAAEQMISILDSEKKARTFGDTCSACGAAFKEGDERAEVIYVITGARSVMHVEEFLADTCCYTLA